MNITAGDSAAIRSMIMPSHHVALHPRAHSERHLSTMIAQWDENGRERIF
jgi:hypothetical protein